MTADSDELIAMLKLHPKACGRLGIVFQFYAADDQEIWWNNTMIGTDDISEVYRHTITGLCVDKCDENGIDVQCSRLGNWYATTGLEDEQITLADGWPSRLHAMIVAIEEIPDGASSVAVQQPKP